MNIVTLQCIVCLGHTIQQSKILVLSFGNPRDTISISCSGSVQLPDTSGSSDKGDVTDRAREDRTKAYVNGDCGVDNGVGSTAKLHKCPSAPCISLQETRSEVCTIRYQNENQQSNSDKW